MSFKWCFYPEAQATGNNNSFKQRFGIDLEYYESISKNFEYDHSDSLNSFFLGLQRSEN